MVNRSTDLRSVQDGSAVEDRSRRERFSSLLKNVAWTPRPSENPLETDGRGVHPTVLHQAVRTSDGHSVRAGRIRLAVVGFSLAAVALNGIVPCFEAVSPGLACCAALLWLTNGIVDERDLRATRFQTDRCHAGTLNAWKWGAGVPLLFAVWSCVEGTFWIGWSLLGAAAVGRGLDWVRGSRWPTNLARDRSFVWWLSLLGLSVAATLLGPNGMPWIEQVRGELILTGNWLGDAFGQITSVESVAFAMTMGNEWDARWWRSAFLACVAGGGVWWLTLQTVKQSGRCFASAEKLVLLLFTLLFWWKPDLGEWFVLAWAIVLAPHLADLVERWDVATETVLGEPSGVSPWTLERIVRGLTPNGTHFDEPERAHFDEPERASVRFGHKNNDKPDASAFRLIIAPIKVSAIGLTPPGSPVALLNTEVTEPRTTRGRSTGRLSDFVLAHAAGWWGRTFRLAVARLIHVARRLARDEDPLRLDVGRSLTASTVWMPVFAIFALAAGTWFVRHAGAGPVGDSECVPRVRPVRVSPLFDEKAVVSDSQLNRVFSSSSLAESFRSGESWDGLFVAPIHDDSDPDQAGRGECPRGRDLARSLAAAGWLGLTTDSVLSVADGERSIGTLLQQLRNEFRLKTMRAEPHPCAESMLAFAFYLPETRPWTDADGMPVTFDILVARVLSPEATADRESLTALDRLWSLAVLLRIDDQQSLLSAATRSLAVARLQVATRQLCEAQSHDGSWGEFWQDEAQSQTAVQSGSNVRLLITARTLAWWGLSPREALPPLDVRARAARWLCDQFEVTAPAQDVRGVVPNVELIPHGGHSVQIARMPVRPAALADAAMAVALWRGRTAAVAFREEQLHRSHSGEGPTDRVAVEPAKARPALR